MTKKQRQNIINEAIKRTKRKLGLITGVDSDVELARSLGVDESFVSDWRSNCTIDLILIFEHLPGVSINWLLSDWKYDLDGNYYMWSLDELFRGAEQIARNRNIKININIEKTV